MDDGHLHQYCDEMGELKQKLEAVAENPVVGEWVDVATLGNQLNAEIQAQKQ